MERVILQFMCIGSLAGITYFRYTVLTSPNKGETAVHCCDPPLSVLVMLVSRNIFHIVSALQSIAGILKTLKGKGLVMSFSGITRLIKKPASYRLSCLSPSTLQGKPLPTSPA